MATRQVKKAPAKKTPARKSAAPARTVSTTQKVAVSSGENTFSITESLRFGWDTTLKNFWFLLGVLVIMWVINAIPSIVTGGGYRGNHMAGGLAYFLLTVLIGIVNLEMRLGLIQILLDLYDRKRPLFSDLFSFFDVSVLVRFFLGSLLYAVLVGVGLVLLIVPGIYFGIKYAFFPYVFVDQKLGVLDSFKASSALTKGVKWKLFGFGLLAFLIIIAGVIAVLLGLLIAIPVVYLATASIYRQLGKK